MFGRMSVRLRPDLRTLLGAAALAALLTTAALGVLLLLTAGSARSVVETAQQTHDRVQAYSLLLSAARGFQNASYAEAHLHLDGTHPVPEVVEHLLEWIGY